MVTFAQNCEEKAIVPGKAHEVNCLFPDLTMALTNIVQVFTIIELNCRHFGDLHYYLLVSRVDLR